jgi:hypothetical protein
MAEEEGWFGLHPGLGILDILILRTEQSVEEQTMKEL